MYNLSVPPQAALLTVSFSCRCGFAGETGPRFIIPSEIRKPGQQVRRLSALMKDEFVESAKYVNVVLFPLILRPSKWFSTTSTQKSFTSSSKSLSTCCTSGEAAACVIHCKKTNSVQNTYGF